jgi:maltooligosyltrehalose synthase
MSAFAADTARLGAAASLSQLVLKATLPGVPDFYQGTELWDFSLVDPDNRRPVDFVKRQTLLREETDTDWRSETFKFHTTCRLLALRKQFPETFESGAYRPIASPDNTFIAFTRACRTHHVLVAARLQCSDEHSSLARLTFHGTKKRMFDLLRNRVVDLSHAATIGDIVGILPVAVLSSSAPAY